MSDASAATTASEPAAADAPAAVAEDFCYYLTKTGEQRGPTHIVALDALRRAGEISDSTLIWRPGFDSWQPYKPKSESKAASNKPAESSAVFVEGLPKAISADQVSHHFQKCGIIKKDPVSQTDRIKFYTSASGERTGEALIIFLQPQSVDLAVQLLDGVDIEPGYPLKISSATFDKSLSKPRAQEEQSSDHRPSAAAAAAATAATVATPNFTSKKQPKKPDQLPDKRIKQVAKKQEQLALSWSDGDGPTKDSALCIVVLKNMFDPQQLLDGGERAVQELGLDIDEGLEAVDGEVKKVTVFKRHPQGVVLVRFADPVHAEECVRVMRGRWFDGRRIDAHLWDGVTTYASTDRDAEQKEQEERMDAFGDYLEGILPP